VERLTHVRGAEPPGLPWTLDRRVSLALIVTVMVWFGGVIYQVASLSAAVGSHGVRILQLEADGRTDFQLLNEVKVLLGRIDERTAILADTMRRAAPQK
jgi:hypothetical protein